MARPINNGLPYIGIPTNWHRIAAHRILRAKLGDVALNLWLSWYLGCFGINGYYLDFPEDEIILTAGEYGVSEEYVRDLLSLLASYDLINGNLLREHHILTSREIQFRYQEAVKKRGASRKVEVERKYWLLSPAETLPFVSFSLERGSLSENESSFSRNPGFCSGNPPETPVSVAISPGFCQQKKKKEKEKKVNKTKEDRPTPCLTPIATRRKRRAVKQTRRTTGQSISRRCESLMKLYGDICGNVLPPPQLTPRVRSLIRQGALLGLTVADYSAAFRAVADSAFLRGGNGQWRATFPWLCTPDKLRRVLRGEYRDFAPSVGGNPPSAHTIPPSALGGKKHLAASSFDTDEFFEAALQRTYGRVDGLCGSG